MCRHGLSKQINMLFSSKPSGTAAQMNRQQNESSASASIHEKSCLKNSCLGNMDANNNCNDDNDKGGDGNNGGDVDSDSDSAGDDYGNDADDVDADTDDKNQCDDNESGDDDSYDDDNHAGHGDGEDDDDDENDHENSDTGEYYGKKSCYSSTRVKETSNAPNQNTECQTQSHSLPDRSSRDEVTRNTSSVAGTSNKTDEEKLQAAGGRTHYKSNLNPEALPLRSDAIHLSQGARPKTSSSQGVPLRNSADPGYLSNNRIPSLEITGIRQDFLARHTTDASLPCESHPGDWDSPTESAQSTNRVNEHSSMLFTPPLPPYREIHMSRQQRPCFSGVQREGIGCQQTSPVISSGSDRQLPYERQAERNLPFTPREQLWWSNHTDPWTANQQQSLAHSHHLGNFPSATWSRVGNSLKALPKVPGSDESSLRYPSFDSYGSQINLNTTSPTNHSALILPTVRSRTPAVMLPRVTTPGAQPQTSASNTVSQSVALNGFPSNAFNGLSGNRQERFSDSSSLRQNVCENQQRGRFVSSEVILPRREELQSGESGSQSLPAAGTSQQGSFMQNTTEDCSLAALERKVAEACAVVERVMREREERTKAQREVARRERERMERMEREERERREREERQKRERETREKEEREKREREARERQARVRERDVTEQTRNEHTPVQESRGWQCQHYQRRCSVSFPCCGIFYPCHRCHNGSGACDANDIKANQATHVKCGNCGHEEEVSNERSMLVKSRTIRIL